MDASTVSGAIARDAPVVMLSVSELFDVEATQGTFQRLVDTINTQALAIERLARRVTTLETTQRHAVAAQQHALQQTDAIVAQIETLQDTQVRADATRRSQQTRMDDLVLVVSRDATLLENAVREIESLEHALETTGEKMVHEMASMELLNRLQDDQYAVHDRIAAMETRVDAKLDKSEMRRLDSVVTKIQAFAPTATQLSTRLGRVEEDTLVMKEALQEQTVGTNRFNHELVQIHLNLDAKVDHASWQEFTEGTVKVALDRLQQDVKVSVVGMNELMHRGVSLETSFRTLSSKLASVTAAIAVDLDTFRSHIKNELKNKLDRSEMNISIQEIHQELSCKAWRKDTHATHESLKQLLARFDEVQQQAVLSTRFLDWYATRGDSYERNLNVVENQLERLAFASAPQLRQPYDDQVRF